MMLTMVRTLGGHTHCVDMDSIFSGRLRHSVDIRWLSQISLRSSANTFELIVPTIVLRWLVIGKEARGEIYLQDVRVQSRLKKNQIEPYESK